VCQVWCRELVWGKRNVEWNFGISALGIDNLMRFGIEVLHMYRSFRPFIGVGWISLVALGPNPNLDGV
jgi:hypothetical protein